MAKVIIVNELAKQIKKKFSKTEALKIVDLLYTVEQNPKKGKAVGKVDNVVIKELKHKTFRFYFISDGTIIKFGTEDQLASLIIKFIKMSDKKDQAKIIKQLKTLLKDLGFNNI